MPESQPSRSLLRRPAFWAVLGGWVLFFILWTLFIFGWGRGEVLLQNAAVSGLIVTVTAAVLSVFVWRLCGRIDWPDSPSARFFVTHLTGAIIYSISWTVLAPVVGTLIEGGAISDIEWNTGAYSWRLLMGIWLYVIVAGLSYAVRINVRLRKQREVSARAEALAAEANLAAMRSQLQPHFLFNALHSVSSLIDTDPPRASEAMEMLGDLLRYAIRDRGSDFVSLSEEWKFVSDYVDLQKIRFGDGVDVKMTQELSIGDVRVPPFVLQPLVENAFLHGISPQLAAGVIEITAVATDGRLALTVVDNGGGPSSEAVTRTGTGLQNLRLRLQALYGNGASVEVKSREGGGTIARVILPDNT